MSNQVGIIDGDRYSPRMSAVYLNLLHLAFPHYTATTLKVRR
jgi:hypothetical protein